MAFHPEPTVQGQIASSRFSSSQIVHAPRRRTYPAGIERLVQGGYRESIPLPCASLCPEGVRFLGRNVPTRASHVPQIGVVVFLDDPSQLYSIMNVRFET